MVLVNCHDKDAAVFVTAARIPAVSIPLKRAERLVESKRNYHQQLSVVLRDFVVTPSIVGPIPLYAGFLSRCLLYKVLI